MSKRNITQVLIAGLLAAPLVALATGPHEGGPACGQAGAHQGGRHGEGQRMSHGMPSGSRHGGGAQGMGMLRGLDLTQAQRDQLFALMHGQMPAQRAQAQELHKAMDELRQLGAGGGFDADKARALTDRIGKLHADRAMMHAETDAKLRALLTPEQRKQFDARQGHAHGRGVHRS